MARTRFILAGAVIGVAWAASLRAFMMVLAGPDSSFTFKGTFGTIIPAGLVLGALLGWAEYQRRIGHQHGALVLSPLVLPLAAFVVSGVADASPLGLAIFAMIGGYSVSGRGPRWARLVAGLVWLAGVPVTVFAPKPPPDLGITTAYGAWFATLAVSLGAVLALACSIPMRRPESRADLWIPVPIEERSVARSATTS